MDFIDKYNKKQIDKARSVVNQIRNDYQGLLEAMSYYKETFQMLINVLKKYDETKIVSIDIRQTYHILVMDFVKKISEIMNSMLLLQNINIFVKQNVGDYVEKHIADLLLFEISDASEITVLTINDEQFTLNQKIKAYVLNWRDLPNNFYKERRGKHLSTNGMALNIINDIVTKIDSIENIIKGKIDKMNNIDYSIY